MAQLTTMRQLAACGMAANAALPACRAMTVTLRTSGIGLPALVTDARRRSTARILGAYAKANGAPNAMARSHASAAFGPSCKLVTTRTTPRVMKTVGVRKRRQIGSVRVCSDCTPCHTRNARIRAAQSRR